jgi:organic radical activating enzyme
VSERKHYLLNLTWRCQNAGVCSYCWVQQTVRQRPEMLDAPERTFDEWLGAIKRDLRAGDTIDLAGGEPFLVDWTIALIEACPELYIGVSTNGLKPSQIEKLSASAPRNVVGMNISYHPEARLRYRNYDELWQRSVMSIVSRGGRPQPNIVDAPGMAEAAEQAVRWMESVGVHAVLSPCEQMGNLGELQPVGLCCQGGATHLNIAPNGDAWPCLTTMRSPYWRETCLGNWIDGTLDLSRKPQPCHLQCVDYFVLPQQHHAGDVWNVQAHPCEAQP